MKNLKESRSKRVDLVCQRLVSALMRGSNRGNASEIAVVIICRVMGLAIWEFRRSYLDKVTTEQLATIGEIVESITIHKETMTLLSDCPNCGHFAEFSFPCKSCTRNIKPACRDLQAKNTIATELLADYTTGVTHLNRIREQITADAVINQRPVFEHACLTLFNKLPAELTMPERAKLWKPCLGGSCHFPDTYETCPVAAACNIEKTARITRDKLVPPAELLVSKKPATRLLGHHA